MTTSIPKKYFIKEKQPSWTTMLDSKISSFAGVGYRLDPDSGVWIVKNNTDFAYSDGDEQEKYILNAIRTAQDVSCSSDELPAKIKDWPSEYHLSPLRINLMTPFQIKQETRILELGCGMGAITRYLGEIGAEVTAVEGSLQRATIARERCRDLNNVQVVCDNFKDFQTDEKFDIVTLIGVMEYSPKYIGGNDPFGECLAIVKNFLRPEGTVIIAIENRLGLKYWNNCAEDHTGRMFDSIHDTYAPRTVTTFGYEELKNVLVTAGFMSIEFIFPFPDYKLPAVILQEEFFKQKEISFASIIGQHPSRDYSGRSNRNFSEQLAWHTIEKNGLIPHFSNSFLCACSLSPDARPLVSKDWIVRIYSSSRSACFRTETTIYRDKTSNTIQVSKERIYPDLPMHQGPLVFNQDIEKNYIQGTMLSDEILRALLRHDTLDIFFQKMKEYKDAVISMSRRINPEIRPGYCPGELFDCTPFNLVRADNQTLHFIDNEWIIKDDLPLHFVLLRGIVEEIINKIKFLDNPFIFGRFATFKDLVAAVFKAMDLRLLPEDIEYYCIHESSIQSQVAGIRHNESGTVMERNAAFSEPLNVALGIVDRLAVYEIFKMKHDELIKERLKKRTVKKVDPLLSERLEKLKQCTTDSRDLLDLHQSAIHLFKQGRPHNAIKVMHQALVMDPGNAEYHNDLGVLYFHTGQDDKAAELFLRAIELNDTESDARKNLADLYAAAGRIAEAEKLYKEVLVIQPDDTEALSELADIYKTIGRLDEASDCHDRIAKTQNKQSRENPSPFTNVDIKRGNPIDSRTIQKGVCNICGSQKGFSLTNPENPRESWVCLSCGSTSRDRMYIYSLSNILGNPSPLISLPKNTTISILEASGARAHPGILKTKFNYLNTQYNSERMAYPDYDRKVYADFQSLHFDNKSFDVVMSSDVFEHIRLHREALKEIYRVLKPGGIMILQAPFHPENKDNIIRVRPEGDKDVFLCSPTYHDEDTLVYRVYGAEFISEIKSTGFIVQVIEDEVPAHCITKQNIILAQKPRNTLVTDMDIETEYSNTSSYKDVTMNKLTIGSETKKSLLVSIIIPVFNQVEYTMQCLEALKKHTPEELYELIIVDNNSTDGTHEYLSSIKDNVKIITNNENQGFTIACNQGAREAKGKYIVFLNNDTIPLDGWLAALIDTFKLGDDIGAVGSKLVYPDMRLQEAGGIIFSDGNGWNFGKGDIADHGRYNRLIEVDYCSAASLAVRKDIFDHAGGFDEIYAPAYYEDTDLCFSIREKGYRVLYQPESEIIHCEGKTAGSNTNSGFKRYQLINREKFRKKWMHRLKDQGPSPYEGAPKPFTADRKRRLAGYAHNKHTKNFEIKQTASSNEQINFLIIDPFLPIYDKASGSFRLFQIVNILANTPRVRVTYIARSGQHGDKYINLLTSLEVEVYHTDPEKLFSFDILGYKHFINLKYILSQRHYHYAFLSFYEIALQYLPDIRLYSPDTRVIIDTVDIHFLREMRQAELYKDETMIKRAINTKKNEISIYQKADALITVTEQDADVVRPYFPDKPIHIIPNIHPLQHNNRPFNKRSGIIFIGNYNHPPNIDAVEYYIKEIHPNIQQKRLYIPVRIIGDGLPEHVRSLAKGLKNIIFTGWVPETKPYMDQARISIAPLRYGAGMKGKVGEALAAGLPVVTTPIGAEGMGLVNRQDVLIANSAEEFADMIFELYRDAALWEKLSENGVRFIEQNYSTSAATDKIRRIFNLPILGIPSYSKELDIEKKDLMISIIILCFNQLDYTKKCLKSIVKYTSVPYELIFVDNGSTDGTAPFLEDYANKHSNCKVILNNENRGFAGGNNQGIAAAEGDYILLLNNDVIVTQDWLERLIAHIESDENIGMIGPVSNCISGPQLVENTGYGQNMNKMKKFARNYSKNNVGRTQDILRLVGFCLLIKRQVLDIIGGLDENYGNGNYEDDDLCLRSRIAGFRNIIAHDVFIHHYGSMTFKGNKIDYTDSLEGNRRRFADKWKDIIEVTGNEYRVRMTKEDQLRKLLEWGEERFSQGNFNAAVKIFERVLKLDKANSQAMNNLGVIQWQISREPASAMKIFQTALTLNPKDSDALENLMQAATESTRFDLINPALLNTLKKTQPANPDLVTLINAQQNSAMTT